MSPAAVTLESAEVRMPPPAKIFPPAVMLPIESLSFAKKAKQTVVDVMSPPAAIEPPTASIPLAAVILPPDWIFPA